MPRYEFSEGTSNKFWEIRLEGTAFVTSYGKIGTSGAETRKEWPNAAVAQKEYDKLVAEKVKKGYQPVGGGKTAPAKAAPAKAAPAKAAAKAAPAAPAKAPAQAAPAAPAASGALRYEFNEGGSSKFWEIEVTGSSFVTRFGKIGTSGQESKKSFGSPADATKESQKLIAEKERKGYQQISGTRPAMATVARKASLGNPELEAAIRANPDADDGYLVYGDWLQANGDPRGQLIALMSAGKKKDAEKLIETHKKTLLPKPPKAGEDDEGDEGGDGYDDFAKGLTWHLGFVKSAKLTMDYDAFESGVNLSGWVKNLLAHPSGRFLRELTLGMMDFEGDNNYGEIIKILEKLHPPLESLFLGDFEFPDENELSWSAIGNASKLWEAVPTLKKVIFQSGGTVKLGDIKAPNLEHFEMRTGGLPKSEIKALAAATWPKLETLKIWFGSSQYGFNGKLDDIKPILDGKGLPKLKHLGLMNAEFTDELAAALSSAKILGQLETLDLSMGTLTNTGAAALAAMAPQLKRLKELNVDDNLVADKKILAPLGAILKYGKQRDDDQDDENEPRYVSVGE